MYTPQGSGGAGTPEPETGQSTDRETVSTVEHCSCGLAGLLATAVLVIFVYPVLVAVTQPLYVLSSTLIVFALFAVWLVTWLALELAWEWRAGRLTVDQ